MAWNGPAGAMTGVGLGSSLEFEDHRPYAVGDDLRHLDWKAYARTDQLIMKQHRHEAAPLVDLALDVSASLWITPEKAQRTLELVAFVLNSALECNAVIRIWAVGSEVESWAVEAALGGHLPKAPSLVQTPALERVPWRRDALRIWISDLLYPLPGHQPLASLGGARGSGLVLAPSAKEEREPSWDGPMEFVDVESQARREEQADAEMRTRYARAWQRHFEAWNEQARRHGVVLARITAESSLTEALVKGALAEGALVWA
jgi:uncharacterized protein (DUF58 family)